MNLSRTTETNFTKRLMGMSKPWKPAQERVRDAEAALADLQVVKLIRRIKTKHL